MKDTISADQKATILSSLQRYFNEHFESEINELQASLLLDYIVREIAPFAYNKGVDDARAYLASRLDDLPGVCFRQGLTYWDENPGSSRSVPRKPGG